MISKGSWDSEDWGNDAENSALITEKKGLFNIYYNRIVILNFNTISQPYQPQNFKQ